MNQESYITIPDFSILDLMPEGVCVLQENFAVHFWNRIMEEWTGISRNEILGKDIFMYFPHLNQPKYVDSLKQVFSESSPTIFSSKLYKCVIPCQLPDGRDRIQNTSLTPVPTATFFSNYQLYESDKIKFKVDFNLSSQISTSTSFYALLIVEDVTELMDSIQDYSRMLDSALEEIKECKQIEKTLLKSHNFLQKIADNTPNIVYLYDIKIQRNIYVNEQVIPMLGYTEIEMKEMGYQLFPNLLHPEDLAQIPERVAKFNLAGDSDILEWEYRIKNSSGEWRWFHTRELIFSRDNDGLPTQILGAAQDISQRKWVEEALRQQMERERLMRLITNHIRNSLNLDEVLNTTVAEVRQFLQTDRAIILQLEPCKYNDSCDFTRAIVIVESVAYNCVSIRGTSLDSCLEAYYVSYYQIGYIRAVGDISKTAISRQQKELFQKWQVKAWIDMPIMQGNKLWGLLIVHHSTPREWPHLEIELMNQLASQLAIAIQQAEIYQQLQVANQELQRLATSDGLTQIANRRRFDEYLESEWLRQVREKHPIALVLVDVDLFKSYNDTYGHLAGDDCLKAVAKAIAGATKRPADLVARYGGEEFALILPYTDEKGALQVAEAVRLAVSGLQIAHSASQINKFVTVSAGVASLMPISNRIPEDLIAAADRALYEAKATGRDRVVTASAILN
ncbi:diguanylate cyclase [Kamptonema sp. UHCC 0994]|uniref:sensor domain-containing diguanylate cyclase n=1 Tax=Kamptonema sp. UHCC 0994 TaxID=3031329 RepID=UPI0023BA0C76|nr:diguanylate cyclase [Kamptonema sp. UHCC 0994]MDF0555256.1 diguanylate cyclase [Kamptonema sp. UHCC 0994]